ncbi:MAPEG family protein [Sphingorhabdus arenilitoris]|uniref:MAPEG family protein n=1 Tax=Sphingorhabdus arenilitoris TaxID=1490041 RepID=A0ABV8RG17_9SPHN
MAGNLLLPAAILILWSMIVLLYMTALRLPALRAARSHMRSAPKGARYQDIEQYIPAKVNWPSHNYTHLLEQPTIFYPAVILLHLSGANDAMNVALAWAYVVLRIVHSLWQIFFNGIPLRMTLFAVSSLCLLALAIRCTYSVLMFTV